MTDLDTLINWIENHDTDEGLLTSEKILGWAKYLQLKSKCNYCTDIKEGKYSAVTCPECNEKNRNIKL